MNIDSITDAVKEEHVQVEETDDSCRFESFEIVPLTRGSGGSCTADCISGDGFAEVKQENLTIVQQEPDDVCCVIYVVHILHLYLTCIYYATTETI